MGLDMQVARRKFRTRSDYLRWLIRMDNARLARETEMTE